jgi:hypothetical protein
MPSIEKIQKLAEKKNIAVDYNTHNSKKAFSVSVDGFDGISIDASKTESTRDEKQTLAEEIAHIDTGYTYQIADTSNPVRRQNIEKADYRASVKQGEILVPLKELKKALKKTTDIFELADFFDIDSSVLLRTIEAYKIKGLL